MAILMAGELKRVASGMAGGLLASILLLTSANAAPAISSPAGLKLWRLQCGKDQPLPMPMFSDTFRYAEGRTKDFTYSCYLIRHGNDYMLWDAGLPNGPRIVDQLRQIGVAPDRIRFLGISHYHFDHIGQAADFPNATLLIGAADFAAVKQGDRLPDNSTDSAVRLAPWVSGGKPVEPLTRDRDVFGDGSVMILNMPGHTPGHHSLLIRLPKSGNILVSGDLYHFPENRENRVVPAFNTNRTDTLASMDRFENVARSLSARVIIQHEPSDVAKLPAFPAAAE